MASANSFTTVIETQVCEDRLKWSIQTRGQIIDTQRLKVKAAFMHSALAGVHSDSEHASTSRKHGNQFDTYEMNKGMARTP